MSRKSSLHRLHQLLLSLFTPGELRSFIYLHLDAELVRSLPVDGTYNEVVYHLVVAFEQHGHLSSDLFERLIEARPLREAEIRQVQEDVLPGSHGAFQIRRAARVRMLQQLDELSAEGVSDNNWRKLVDIVKEGFRDFTLGSAGKGLGLFADLWAKLIHESWDSLFDGRKGEPPSTR